MPRVKPRVWRPPRRHDDEDLVGNATPLSKRVLWMFEVFENVRRDDRPEVLVWPLAKVVRVAVRDDAWPVRDTWARLVDVHVAPECGADEERAKRCRLGAGADVQERLAGTIAVRTCELRYLTRPQDDVLHVRACSESERRLDPGHRQQLVYAMSYATLTGMRSTRFPLQGDSGDGMGCGGRCGCSGVGDCGDGMGQEGGALTRSVERAQLAWREIGLAACLAALVSYEFAERRHRLRSNRRRSRRRR